MQRKFKPAGGIRLVCVLLSLVLTLSVMAGIVITDFRLATTKENAARIIRQALFRTHTVATVATENGSHAAHAPVSLPRPHLSVAKLDKESSGIITDVMVEWLYDNLSEQYGEENLVSKEDIEAFINESTLKDDISGLAASLINDFITGENTTSLDAETLRTLVNENAAVIEKYFGVTVSEEMVSGLVETITTSDYVAQLQEDGIGGLLINAGSQITGQPDAAGPDGGNDGTAADTSPVAELLTSFRQATSVGAIIGCFGTAAVCMVVLILLNLKYLWYALRKIGVSLAVASLPSFVPTVLYMIQKEAFNSTVVGAVVGLILQITAPVCISIFAVGAVLIVVSFIMKAQMKKNVKLTDATEEISASLVQEEPVFLPTEEPETVEPEAAEPTEEII